MLYVYYITEELSVVTDEEKKTTLQLIMDQTSTAIKRHETWL